MTPEDLVIRHAPWAKRKARGYNSPMLSGNRLWITIEDLESAALIGLWRAAQRFDGIRSFRAYARRRVKGAIQDELRKMMSKRWSDEHNRVEKCINWHRGLTAMGSEGEEEYLASQLPSPEQRLIDKESARNGLRSLSDRELEAVEGQCKGLTLREIGAGWGVSEARACQVLAAAREKLREAA